jgi:hypothetical protein
MHFPNVRRFHPFVFLAALWRLGLGCSVVREWRRFSVSEGNSAFEIRGGFLVDVVNRSMILYFGSESVVTVPRDIEHLDRCSFPLGKERLWSVTFEVGSSLSRIDESAFASFSSLASISVPGSVAVLCDRCFCDCKTFSTVTFELGSKLSHIERSEFSSCSLLPSISISSSVEVLCDRCFSECTALSSVTFEAGSHIRRIEESAFSQCSRLSSISVPSSIEVIGARCFTKC